MSEDMNDNELLELAAKAAGYPWRGFSANGQPLLNADVSKPEPWLYVPYVWDPLTDDGDALRLALRLDIVFQANCFEEYGNMLVSVRVYDTNGVEICSVQEPCLDDFHANIRRAIVRAAAKIGKGME
jgi:hypothetical protein